jgi:4-hydroxybenzoate polyprenyltransferase
MSGSSRSAAIVHNDRMRQAPGVEAAVFGVRRSRWRAYLLLARISNLPTVWTNVLAGTVAAGTVLDWSWFFYTALAASLFYSSGMFLNDAFDADVDRRTRPERPIPAGDLSRAEAFSIGAALLVAGALMLAANLQAFVTGLVLAAAIVWYDARHKGVSLAPVVMGGCRALVYVLAAAMAGQVSTAAVVCAVAMGSYIVGLTVVAKLSGPKARWRVPLLIAGISLVDALFILLISENAVLAALSASGFALTLLLQRYVPGD